VLRHPGRLRVGDRGRGRAHGALPRAPHVSV